MENSHAVTVEQMMRARDARAQRQRALLDAWQAPLCCLTLNIAGPVKAGGWIDDAFAQGVKLAAAQIRRLGMTVLAEEQIAAETGHEMYWVVRASAAELKRAMIAVEDASAFGRLLDLDVLCAQGEKMSREELGLPPRTCLLCDRQAALCARSRTHTVQALTDAAQATVRAYFAKIQADVIAATATRSLLYELLTTPKPGLVDRANSGSHQDMDCFTFAASASALTPYFHACAQAGNRSAAGEEAALFPRLRQMGQCAEEDMLRATGGINTHKGAIFSLGLLCAAAGQLWAQRQPLAADALCCWVAELVGEPLRDELAAIQATSAQTAGERVYAHTGLRGARGEAAAGFPSVLHHGLPELQRALAGGDLINQAAVKALLRLMSVAEDTNMVHRGSAELRQEIAGQAQALLEAPRFSLAAVRAMDRQLIAQRISPGGSADLLAVTLFLHALPAACAAV